MNKRYTCTFSVHPRAIILTMINKQNLTYQHQGIYPRNTSITVKFDKLVGFFKNPPWINAHNQKKIHIYICA